ncbi:sulfite exporter TauE/SafE family protein [Tistrella mobilis]|jgi:uncharacterized membrane protein YfcA|uniref:sulfite exporter TauE/SafE family protein n=1 Tax=Tistrella mobilis TaxID=171437 RepID=UPI0035562188
MQIYLPIAELSIDAIAILLMGLGVGFLSGLVGVGGGFLMTPLLMFVGVPPPVAVATGANQVVAASVSGLLAHWRRGTVDVRMGGVLLIGGLAGSGVGILIFRWLQAIGQIDLVIGVSYVLFLGVIGVLMGIESVRSLLVRNQPAKKRHQHNWMHGLPFKLRFRKSKLYISALLPLVLGAGVGVLTAILGVGGGFIMIPAMIYILGMPTLVVVGTSLFQILFVSMNVTVMHAVTTEAVDLVLAAILVVGSVIGAQVGSRLTTKLRGEHLRGLLAAVVVLTAIKIGADLVIRPDELFSAVVVGPG